MAEWEFEKIISEFSISKVVVGDHRFAEVCPPSFPSNQSRNEPLLFIDFRTEGINKSLTICSISNLAADRRPIWCQLAADQ